MSLPSCPAISLDEISERLTTVEIKQGKFITWPWFITTMIIIGGMQLSLYMYLVSEIKQLQAAQQDTKNTVFEINGKLQPFEFLIE